MREWNIQPQEPPKPPLKPKTLEELKKAAIEAHFRYQQIYSRCLRGEVSVKRLSTYWSWVLEKLNALHQHPDFMPNKAPSEATKKLVRNIT